MLLSATQIQEIFNVNDTEVFDEASCKHFLVKLIDRYGFPYVYNHVCVYFAEQNELAHPDTVLGYIKNNLNISHVN